MFAVDSMRGWQRAVAIGALLTIAVPVPAASSQRQPVVQHGEAPSAGVTPTTPLPAGDFTPELARHLLLRAGFGGTPEEIAALHGLGLEGAVRRLVDYEDVPDLLPPHGVVPVPRPARAELANLTQEERQRAAQMVRREDQQQFQQLRGWWIGRMLATQRPLQEKLTLFWHGHFTSGYRDVRNAYHMAMQNDLLREHASGSFRTLLEDISRDPAMLEYLDNNRNNRRAPNENYARELLELFTLGVGNYTEQDVKEAARAFTGWTFRNSEFVVQPFNHDPGRKTFLGRTGAFDGDDVIRIVLEQPAAARHLARKLLTFFAVEPTDEEVEPYAQVLRQFQWELKPFLRMLFSSRWFYGERVRAKQIKSPVMLIVSTLRAMGVERAPGLAIARACDSIGQSLMEPPNVKGWDGGAAWISSSNLLARYNIARTLIAGGELARAGDGARGRRPMMPPDRAAPSEPAMRGDPGMQGEPDMQTEQEEGGMQEEGGRQLSTDPDAMRRRRDDRARRPPAAPLRGPGRSGAPFSTLGLVTAAKVTDAAAIVRVLEQRFLVAPLAPERRQALIEFLTGKDGSPALDLRQRRPAAAKLDECLHLLMTAPEFQVC